MTIERPLPSIRARVTTVAVVLLGLLSGALLLLAWRSAERAADEAFDRVIGASTLSIADSMRIDDDRIKVELPQAALAMIGLQSDARVFYRVAGPDGELIAGHVTLGLALPPASSAEPLFSTGDYRGVPVRFALAGRYFESGWASVIVAETLESRQALARKLFTPALIAVFVVSVIALALLSFGLRRAFRPIALIEDELRLRGPTDLAPLKAAAPIEVRRLVGALDDFMLRLQGTLDRLNHYASHAAHEVRTPIAAIRAQTAAALAEPKLADVRQRLRRIEANAEAAGQIVNQILSDASVQHRLGLGAGGAIDLVALCEEVIDRLDPLIQAAVQLRVAGADRDAAKASGDPVAVREAIRNLVDNALKYAPSGVVGIDIRRHDGGWVVDVTDSGPGIHEESMERMTERFSRGETAGVPGAGLGLHIVRRVAEASGGGLELGNRPEGGLSARLRLRAAAAAMLAMMIGGWPHDASAQQRPTLRILASTDRGLVEPLVAAFQATRPEITVQLDRVNSQLAFTTIQSQAASGEGPDLVLGHAADIMVEMANDGYASAGLAPPGFTAPAWASWRGEIVAFALDEGVFIYRRSALGDEAAPASRRELALFLDHGGDRLRGRIGTLDVGNNSIAYLLASQEARLSSAYWRLIRAFGSAEARIYWSTEDMLDGLRRGEIDVAYNAVVSELGELRSDDRFVIVRASDYRLAFPRAALMPRHAKSTAEARDFVAFALSPAGQAVIAGAGAQPIASPTGNRTGGRREPALQPIALGPGLLALRDLHTRSNLMETWLQLILIR